MQKIILLFFVVNYVSGQQSAMMSCCKYCRSEPNDWITLSGTFQLSAESEKTKMNSPPAFMVGDEEEALFTQNGKEYSLIYSGAPLKLTSEDLSNPETVKKSQFMQYDLATPKTVGGLLSQGGFFEEKLNGLFPRKETWVTEFAVSYSNDSKTFHFYTDSSGQPEIFKGGKNYDDSSMASFSPFINARFIRYHPLKAQQAAGAVKQVNSRTTIITCSFDNCRTQRINCLLSEWSQWTSCTCSGTCTRQRTRITRRVQACGGSRCESLFEKESCTAESPAWQSGVLYGGIAVGSLIVICVVAFIIYKKKHQDRVEVIVVRENAPAPRPRLPVPRMAGPRPGMAPMAPMLPRGQAPFARPRGPMPPGTGPS